MSQTMPQPQTTTAWTYETLAEADRKTLEKVLLAGPPPDPDQLEGYIYCGWNHEWVGRLSGEKFKKGFRQKDGAHLGYNEMVRQDGEGYKGDWEVRMKKGRPKQVGYFRVSLVADEPPRRLHRRYGHTGHFDYNVSQNVWWNFPFRVIRDYVVLPNPGDHGLLLCKAYFRFGFDWATIFYCYFLLGHRLPIEHEPW